MHHATTKVMDQSGDKYLGLLICFSLLGWSLMPILYFVDPFGAVLRSTPSDRVATRSASNKAMFAGMSPGFRRSSCGMRCWQLAFTLLDRRRWADGPQGYLSAYRYRLVNQPKSVDLRPSGPESGPAKCSENVASHVVEDGSQFAAGQDFCGVNADGRGVHVGLQGNGLGWVSQLPRGWVEGKGYSCYLAQQDAFPSTSRRGRMPA